VAEVMFEEFREARYAPPPLLSAWSWRAPRPQDGRGFYTYDGK